MERRERAGQPEVHRPSQLRTLRHQLSGPRRVRRALARWADGPGISRAATRPGRARHGGLAESRSGSGSANLAPDPTFEEPGRVNGSRQPAILVGLIGAGIQASRTPALHERSKNFSAICTTSVAVSVGVLGGIIAQALYRTRPADRQS